jgi:TrmH family RNA methyltransferase
VRSGLALETIFIREGSEALLSRPLLSQLEPRTILTLGRDVFASAVDTPSPQGIAAILLIPDLPRPDLYESHRQHHYGITLILEDLQDPGNVGALIRSAEAFGVQQIILTPGSVNPWNPKVVRASAGSVFRMPITRSTIPETKSWLRDLGIPLIAAVAQSDASALIFDMPLRAPKAFMIGNEGAGLSTEALAQAEALIHIPCAVESLNAAIAGSILMYEALRQNQTGSLKDMSFAGRVQ